MTPSGAAAAHLSWLSPRAASLAALARPGPATWQQVRTDPGAILLLARFAGAARTTPIFSPALLRDPAVLEGALGLFDQPGQLPWHQPAFLTLHRTALT